MNKRLKYSGTDKMSDLICENYNLLLVMSRFGLSLGFGDQTVQQVCERQGVHTGTFLAVVNFMDGECCVSEEFHSRETFGPYYFPLDQAIGNITMGEIRNDEMRALYRACQEADADAIIEPLFDSYVYEKDTKMLITRVRDNTSTNVVPTKGA